MKERMKALMLSPQFYSQDWFSFIPIVLILKRARSFCAQNPLSTQDRVIAQLTKVLHRLHKNTLGNVSAVASKFIQLLFERAVESVVSGIILVFYLAWKKLPIYRRALEFICISSHSELHATLLFSIQISSCCCCGFCSLFFIKWPM